MSVASRFIASRRLKLCTAVLGALASLAQADTAPEQAQAPAVAKAPARQTYSLPAAPLADTLQAISKISGRAIAFDAEHFGKVIGGAVSGDLTPLEAVKQAVVGTNLPAREGKDGALAVGVTDLGTVTIYAKRDQAETSFMADSTDTATRSGANLLDTPSSVTIITSKVLETQQATSVYGALSNVSSVGFNQTPQGSPTFTIRGFSATNATVNGVTDEAAALTNVFGVERIEVLKGPQAILAGANSLGGTVNVVLKKPQADTVRSVTLQYGSHGDKTVAVDLSGTFSDDKRLTYRLIASDAQASNAPGGWDGRKDQMVMPEIRWKDATTDLIVGMSYSKQHQAPPLYTFANGTQILPAPDERLGNASDGFDTRERKVFYSLEQKINDNVTFVSRFDRSLFDLSLHLSSPAGIDFSDGVGTGALFNGLNYNNDRTSSGDHYLRITGDTGPIAHKVSVGISHSYYHDVQTQWSGSFLMPQLYPADPTFVWPDIFTDSNQLSLINNLQTTQLGVVAQDLMSWGDWNLLVNVRRDRYTESDVADYVGYGTFPDTPLNSFHTSPGVGVIYNVTPHTSVYANLSQGFVPQNSVKCGGGVVNPITTHNKEVGAKFDFLDSKLMVTTALFEVSESNTLLYVPTSNCYNVQDAQVTKGIEGDIQGQLTKGWNLLTNYTFSTVRDASNSNTMYSGVPKNKMSLWTTYDVQNHPELAGLGFGLGITASASMQGTYIASQQFRIPGQTQVDASAFYKMDKWNFTFGIKNVMNRLLYGVSSGNSYIPILDRRNFMLTAKHDFN